MEKKTVYIAAKLGTMEPKVKALMQELTAMGFEIIYDWTATPVSKPFETHAREAGAAAEFRANAVCAP